MSQKILVGSRSEKQRQLDDITRKITDAARKQQTLEEDKRRDAAVKKYQECLYKTVFADFAKYHRVEVKAADSKSNLTAFINVHTDKSNYPADIITPYFVAKSTNLAAPGSAYVGGNGQSPWTMSISCGSGLTSASISTEFPGVNYELVQKQFFLDLAMNIDKFISRPLFEDFFKGGDVAQIFRKELTSDARAEIAHSRGCTKPEVLDNDPEIKEACWRTWQETFKIPIKPVGWRKPETPKTAEAPHYTTFMKNPRTHEWLDVKDLPNMTMTLSHATFHVPEDKKKDKSKMPPMPIIDAELGRKAPQNVVAQFRAAGYIVKHPPVTDAMGRKFVRGTDDTVPIVTQNSTVTAAFVIHPTVSKGALKHMGVQFNLSRLGVCLIEKGVPDAEASYGTGCSTGVSAEDFGGDRKREREEDESEESEDEPAGEENEQESDAKKAKTENVVVTQEGINLSVV